MTRLVLQTLNGREPHGYLFALTVILDTNVFVAAAFNPRSAAASILERVRLRQIRMVWTHQTRHETQHIVEKIPPLSWADITGLFRDEDCYPAATEYEQFEYIPDREDRKFAALAAATGAALLTNDRHLLDFRDRAELKILTPSEYERSHTV